MRRTQIHICFLLLICAAILFTNLGTARLWSLDEAGNAGCAVEMMDRGDLVVPIFNDELRAEGPPLLYWLIVSSYQVFGVNEFAARFWSALLAMGTVIGTYCIGRRLFNSNVALAGALALSSSILFVVAGRSATPDAALMFCSTMALLVYVLGTFAPRTNEADAPSLHWPGYYFPQKLRYVIGMYAFMGLGVLAKGLVGFLLPWAVIVLFMLIQRLPKPDNETWNSRGWFARLASAVLRPFKPRHVGETLWSMRPVTMAIVILAIVGPWLVMVGIQTNWEWPKQFLISENTTEGSSALERPLGGLLYYPLVVLAGFFPWSVFLAPTLLGIDKQISRKHHWSIPYTFLLCWIGIQVGVFTFAPTRLPAYIGPCFPALALLTGTFLVQLAADKTSTSTQFNQWTLISIVLAGVLLTAGLAVTSNMFFDGDFRIVLIGLIPIVGGSFAWWTFSQEDGRQTINACYATAIVFVFVLFGFGSTFIDSHQHSNRIIDQVAKSGEQPVATFGCMESSWVFYGRRPIYELSRDKHSDSWSPLRQNPWERKTSPSPEQFVRAHPDALVITTEKELEQLKARLPKNFEVLKQASYFMKNRDLVLLGPKDSGSNDARKQVAETQSGDVR